MPIHRFVCDASAAGQRLDRWLTDRLDGTTRSAVQKLIADTRCRIEGAEARPSLKLKAGQVILLDKPEAAAWTLQAEDIPVRILYQDEDLLVVDKPSGMVVHPGAGHRTGTLAAALLHCLPSIQGVGDAARPGMVHRLDKNTSGVLVLAKNNDALAALQRQFHDRLVEKTYLALVWGNLRERHGEIGLPIGRSRVHGRMIAHGRHAREALTRWKLTERFGTWCDLLQVHPKTGRTHQIRVHFAATGHAIVGDLEHGRRRLARSAAPPDLLAFPRTALHAWKIAFTHPRSSARIEVTSEVPRDFSDLLESLRRSCAGEATTP